MFALHHSQKGALAFLGSLFSLMAGLGLIVTSGCLIWESFIPLGADQFLSTLFDAGSGIALLLISPLFIFKIPAFLHAWRFGFPKKRRHIRH